jgi:hypothetical protein
MATEAGAINDMQHLDAAELKMPRTILAGSVDS